MGEQYEQRHRAAGAGFLVIRNKDETTKIIVKEILFVEQRARKLMFQTLMEKAECYGRIAQIKETLGISFVFAHSYLLVNLSRIVKMKQGEIHFDNGHVLHMGKQSFNHTRRAFEEYLGL